MRAVSRWLSRMLRRRHDRRGGGVDDRAHLQRQKPCAVSGCGGTMQLRDARREAEAPHTLEWPWLATWVCDRDRAHDEVVAEPEYRNLGRSRTAL